MLLFLNMSVNFGCELCVAFGFRQLAFSSQSLLSGFSTDGTGVLVYSVLSCVGGGLSCVGGLCSVFI